MENLSSEVLLIISHTNSNSQKKNNYYSKNNVIGIVPISVRIFESLVLDVHDHDL